MSWWVPLAFIAAGLAGVAIALSLTAGRPRSDPAAESSDATEKNGKPRKAVAGPVDRHGKPIAKPSFRRVLRRTAIFGPLIAIFIYITAKDLSPAGLVLNVLLLLAFFMPLSYVVDTVVYRMLWRRYEKSRET